MQVHADLLSVSQQITLQTSSFCMHTAHLLSALSLSIVEFWAGLLMSCLLQNSDLTANWACYLSSFITLLLASSSLNNSTLVW